MTETPREQAFCAYTILTPDSLLIIPDATTDKRFCDNVLVTGQMGIRSYVGAPLMVKDDLPIGALCVIDSKPRTFSEDELGKFRNVT